MEECLKTINEEYDNNLKGKLGNVMSYYENSPKENKNENYVNLLNNKNSNLKEKKKTNSSTINNNA